MVERAGRRLAALSLRHPAATLGAAAVIALAAVPGLWRLELQVDGRALAPPEAPAVRLDRELAARFGVRDPVVVVLRSQRPEGIWAADVLAHVERLSTALRQIDGVRAADVTSLATEPGLRHRPGSLHFANLLEPLPETMAAIAAVRADVERIGLYSGTLVADDATAAAILVGLPPAADRGATIAEIRRVAAAVEPPAGTSVAVLGAPVAEALLGRHVLADLGVARAAEGAARWGPAGRSLGMAPLAVVVMGLVFLIAFRRPAAALLPLAEVAFCLLSVFGLMGWLGHPVYLTTTVLPVVLTAVATTDEIHIFHRFVQTSGDSHRQRIATALDEMAPPLVRTSLTTAVAFLAFAVSPLAPVRSFGLYAAFGVGIALLFSLTAVPALLLVLGPRWWRQPVSRPTSLSMRLAGWAVRHRRAVLVASGLVALLALDGLRRLEVQDSWLAGFAPQSAFARDTGWFEDRFHGAHLLRLVVEGEAPHLDRELVAEDLGRLDLRLPATVLEPGLAPERFAGSAVRVFREGGDHRQWRTWVEAARREGDHLVLELPRRGGSPRFWLRPAAGERLGLEIRGQPLAVPAVLARLDGLEAFLAAQPGVGGVLGPARYLKTVSFMMSPDSALSRRLPEDPRQARLAWSNYGRVRGEERLRQLVDADLGRALVTVYLVDSNYLATRDLLERVRAYEAEELRPHGLRLGFAGDVAVSQALVEGVVASQVRSLALALVAIAALAAALQRSLGRGLLVVVPPAFAVLLGGAAMGWTGIPLGVATSMFAGMTLGVGVDFAIHLLARRDLVRARGLAPRAAIVEAATVTGPAIGVDALALGLGFGALLASQVPANARLGGILAISLAGCWLAALLLVPAFAAWSRRAGGAERPDPPG